MSSRRLPRAVHHVRGQTGAERGPDLEARLYFDRGRGKGGLFPYALKVHLIVLVLVLCPYRRPVATSSSSPSPPPGPPTTTSTSRWTLRPTNSAGRATSCSSRSPSRPFASSSSR